MLNGLQYFVIIIIRIVVQDKKILYFKRKLKHLNFDFYAIQLHPVLSYTCPELFSKNAFSLNIFPSYFGVPEIC